MERPKTILKMKGNVSNVNYFSIQTPNKWWIKHLSIKVQATIKNWNAQQYKCVAHAISVLCALTGVVFRSKQVQIRVSKCIALSGRARWADVNISMLFTGVTTGTSQWSTGAALWLVVVGGDISHKGVKTGSNAVLTGHPINRWVHVEMVVMAWGLYMYYM